MTILSYPICPGSANVWPGSSIAISAPRHLCCRCTRPNPGLHFRFLRISLRVLAYFTRNQPGFRESSPSAKVVRNLLLILVGFSTHSLPIESRQSCDPYPSFVVPKMSSPPPRRRVSQACQPCGLKKVKVQPAPVYHVASNC